MSIYSTQGDSANILVIESMFKLQSTQIEQLEQACTELSKATFELDRIEHHSTLKQMFTEIMQRGKKLLEDAHLKLRETKELKHQIIKDSLPETQNLDPALNGLPQLWVKRRCVQKFFTQHFYSLTSNYLNQNLLRQTRIANELTENIKENVSSSSRLQAAESIDNLLASIEENSNFTLFCEETLTLHPNPEHESTIRYEETALWLFENFSRLAVHPNVALIP